jgi:hypothetical protein
MKKIVLILTPLILLVGGIMGVESGFGQVYKWIDEKGAVHFTDDPVQVPEKYRSRTERIGLPEDNSATSPAGAPGDVKKKEDVYRDQLGRGEEYWRGRVEEWRKKLKTTQDKLEALRTRYNELVERFNESKSTAQRAALRKDRDEVKSEMDRCRTEIEEAITMLDRKIPEEAGVYKAKAEWVK